jgi:hypothetical protein
MEERNPGFKIMDLSIKDKKYTLLYENQNLI